MAYLTCLMIKASTVSTKSTSLYLSMASTYLLSVYQPENKDPEILSRRCLRSLSSGATPELACETFEQRDKVELDLDMAEPEPGGNLSDSKLLELVLFLPRIGVDIGVLLSETSESDVLD